jgi:hypothetical protein
MFIRKVIRAFWSCAFKRGDKRVIFRRQKRSIYIASGLSLRLGTSTRLRQGQRKAF